MTIYTGTIAVYNSWKEQIGKSANLASDTFKMLLTTSGYSPNLSVDSVLADITNEVSGSGYTRATLGSVSFTESGGIATFDFADPTFTASGGNIIARRWVIFDDTVASPVKPLMFTGLLDAADADVTVTSGNTLTFNVNASGLFTLS